MGTSHRASGLPGGRTPLRPRLEPLSIAAPEAFDLLAGARQPCFLDSGGHPGELGRRSFVAACPFLVVRFKASEARLEWPRMGKSESWKGNPFELLRRLLREFPAETHPVPLASGGAVGYLAYDLFPHVEHLEPRAVDDLRIPDLYFCFYDVVGVFDHGSGEALLAVSDWGGPPGPKRELIDLWKNLPERATEPAAPPSWADPEDLERNFTRERYRSAIRRAKDLIAAGEIYQVNLSQRFAIPHREEPRAFYRRLREVSPAPFGACLVDQEYAVFSNSPERYLLIEGDHIETRPIKGTRPRGRDEDEDRRLAEELRRSEKDRAEHVMIVDLERNDLGRVCQYTSVHVPQFEKIESYANVHHMVSTVAGRVHPSRDAVDCIRNSFPGGSITGAPKVRAMEIIDELEPTARGVYCGSVGYIDFSGRVDLNIAIRTAVQKEGRLTFQVGGGIVADSDPDDEYEETLTKAQAFLKALTGEGRVWPRACA